jgi:hypothetical protein
MGHNDRNRCVELAVSGGGRGVRIELARAALDRILIDLAERRCAEMLDDRLQKPPSAVVFELAQRVVNRFDVVGGEHDFAAHLAGTGVRSAHAVMQVELRVTSQSGQRNPSPQSCEGHRISVLPDKVCIERAITARLEVITIYVGYPRFSAAPPEAFRKRDGPKKERCR